MTRKRRKGVETNEKQRQNIRELMNIYRQEMRRRNQRHEQRKAKARE